LALSTTIQVGELDPDADTRIAGLLTKMEVRLSQKDKRPWARITLEDLTGNIEVLVFPDTYADLSRTFAVGEVVVIAGQVDRKEDTPKIRASAMYALEEARDQFYRGVVLNVPLADWSSQRWHDLQEFVFSHPGSSRLHFRCQDPSGATVELETAASYNVGISSDFCRELKEFLGQQSFQLIASRQVAKQKPRKWMARKN